MTRSDKGAAKSLPAQDAAHKNECVNWRRKERKMQRQKGGFALSFRSLKLSADAQEGTQLPRCWTLMSRDLRLFQSNHRDPSQRRVLGKRVPLDPQVD